MNTFLNPVSYMHTHTQINTNTHLYTLYFAFVNIEKIHFDLHQWYFKEGKECWNTLDPTINLSQIWLRAESGQRPKFPVYKHINSISQNMSLKTYFKASKEERIFLFQKILKIIISLDKSCLNASENCRYT